jgi:hypothetical protein
MPKSSAGLERNPVPLSAEITCRFQPKSGADLLRSLQSCGLTFGRSGWERSLQMRLGSKLSSRLILPLR